jgi:AhpD family alkylhydroperoxidase
VYKQISRDFGFVGDIFKMHSPTPTLLTGVWAAFRETELVGEVSRGLKEAVALAVSKVNQCPFCIDAHSTLLAAVGNQEVAQKILNDQVEEITDPKTRSIVNWAMATRSPGSKILANPPFSEAEAPEIIGTAVINHYINRMIDVLLTNKSLLPIRNSFLKKLITRVTTPLLSRLIKNSENRGDALRFLSEHEPAKDMAWAASHPIISRAFAGFAAATEELGDRVFPSDARSVVEAYISTWNGIDPGLGRGWVQQETSRLTGVSQTTAKLSLLTAIAPYQVDDTLVMDFRSHFPEDEQLLQLLSWSSLTAARKIGTWLS